MTESQTTLGRADVNHVSLPVKKTVSPSNAGPNWSYLKTSADGRTVDIVWLDSSASCGRADQVQLNETSKDIIIGLVPGKITATACTGSAITYETQVRLAIPIGERKLTRPLPKK